MKDEKQIFITPKTVLIVLNGQILVNPCILSVKIYRPVSVPTHIFVSPTLLVSDK